MLGGSWVFIIYVVVFIGIFYFMAIKPQQRQRKLHQELLSKLKKGDQVLTVSGIYGRVKRVNEDIVTLEIAKGVSINVTRNAVSSILDKQQAKAISLEPSKVLPAEIEEEYDDYDDEEFADEEEYEEEAEEEYIEEDEEILIDEDEDYSPEDEDVVVEEDEETDKKSGGRFSRFLK